MDAHITKPIDKNLLYRTIAKFTNQQAFLTKKPKKRAAITLDRDYLIQSIGSQSLANTLLLKFKDQVLSGEFKDAFELIKSDHKDAKTVVHTLKGVCGNLGAFELYEALSLIDDKYKEGQLIDSKLISQLFQALQNLTKELKSIKPDIDSDEIDEILSQNDLKELFLEVKDLLNDGQIIEKKSVLTLYKSLSTTISSKELEKWKELVENFDFGEAAKLMEKWQDMQTFID